MVDIAQLRRTAPAPSPSGYQTLQAWLEVSTDRRGMPAELARYCDVERQNVQKWLTGSLPAGPALRRSIAEWAQVPYEELRDLIERDEARRILAPKRAAAKKKTALKRRA